jgi:hypothetical protein
MVGRFSTRMGQTATQSGKTLEQGTGNAPVPAKSRERT